MSKVVMRACPISCPNDKISNLHIQRTLNFGEINQNVEHLEVVMTFWVMARMLEFMEYEYSALPRSSREILAF